MTDYMITLNKSDDHCFKSGPGSHKRIDIYGNCLFVGLDDTFSEEECRELTEFLQSALENGILRAEKCELCNNDCLDLFMFEHDEEDQTVSLKCMCCGQRKAIGDSGDDTADNQTAESADDQFSIVCDCGNHSRDLFSVNGGDDGDFVIFQCLVCDATFLLQTSFAKQKSRPTEKKPATGSYNHVFV